MSRAKFGDKRAPELSLGDLGFGGKSGLTARRAPAQQRLGRTGIDHAVFGDPTLGGAVTADVLPLELTWCVCIGINGEPAADIDGQLEQIARRVFALRSRVDLDCDVVVSARGKDGCMVELGLRTSTADNDATGAMSQDVHVRVFDCREHALGHHVAG